MTEAELSSLEQHDAAAAIQAHSASLEQPIDVEVPPVDTVKPRKFKDQKITRWFRPQTPASALDETSAPAPAPAETSAAAGKAARTAELVERHKANRRHTLSLIQALQRSPHPVIPFKIMLAVVHGISVRERLDADCRPQLHGL